MTTARDDSGRSGLEINLVQTCRRTLDTPTATKKSKALMATKARFGLTLETEDMTDPGGQRRRVSDVHRGLLVVDHLQRVASVHRKHFCCCI